MFGKTFFLMLSTLIVVGLAFVLANRDTTVRIMPQELFEKMSKAEDLVIFDYRTKVGIIRDNRIVPGAIWVANSLDVNREIENISKDSFIVTYCK